MKVALETIEQRTQREREIASKQQVLAMAEHCRASADAIIARIQRELCELKQSVSE